MSERARRPPNGGAADPQSPRDRILAAVARVAAERGYGAMAVEDVLAAAGASRRTFYAHFANREDAFLAAYGQALTELIEAVRAARPNTPSLAERLTASARAMLTFFGADADRARLCVVEPLAAGAEAVRRRDEAIAALTALLTEDARSLLPPDSGVGPLTAQLVIGGVYEVVYARVLRGEASALPDLLSELVYAVLLPYVGARSAAAAARRASA